jgi:hypothetical protein
MSQQVRLLGAVTNERVWELMTAADVFFLPSQWEGVALSLYEAMACGVVVVGAAVGGQHELVTPECGILVGRGDENTEMEQYATVLAALLQDAPRRQAMGRAGRERVCSHFRLEQMGDRMTVLLQETLRLHTTQPRPAPSRSVGLICATQAVEYLRLAAVADWLWLEQERRAVLPGFLPQMEDLHNGHWRASAYFAVRRRLLPYYRAALGRNFTWLLPLKNRLKRALLPGEPA